ncbi:ATP-dependent DNA ligase [Williamsia sp. SKLECPSW1]
MSSRNGASITRTYPEIVVDLRAALAGRSVILDGEIVALEDDVREEGDLPLHLKYQGGAS